MIKYHRDFIQHSDEWRAARCGLLTASEMDRIITPAKLQYSSSKETKTHLFELMAQRVNSYVEPQFQNFDMQRGEEDESRARETYHEKFAPVDTCGFVTNDKWGFTLGFSPDGIVGDDGIIEAKSRLQKYQMQTIVQNEMPDDFKIQVQTGLLVTERAWCDFITYCGGMKMWVLRVMADKAVQNAILAAATQFEETLAAMMKIYDERLSSPDARFVDTERVEREMHV